MQLTSSVSLASLQIAQLQTYTLLTIFMIYWQQQLSNVKLTKLYRVYRRQKMFLVFIVIVLLYKWVFRPTVSHSYIASLDLLLAVYIIFDNQLAIYRCTPDAMPKYNGLSACGRWKYKNQRIIMLGDLVRKPAEVFISVIHATTRHLSFLLSMSFLKLITRDSKQNMI